MAKGENIFKRKNGRWEARYIKGKRYALNPVRFSWKEYAVTALGIVFLALLLFLDHTSIGEIIIWRV